MNKMEKKTNICLISCVILRVNLENTYFGYFLAKIRIPDEKSIFATLPSVKFSCTMMYQNTHDTPRKASGTVPPLAGPPRDSTDLTVYPMIKIPSHQAKKLSAASWHFSLRFFFVGEPELNIWLCLCHVYVCVCVCVCVMYVSMCMLGIRELVCEGVSYSLFSLC